MVMKKPLDPEDEDENQNVLESKDVIVAFLMVVTVSIVAFFYGGNVTGQVSRELQGTANSLFMFIFFIVGITIFLYMKGHPEG